MTASEQIRNLIPEIAKRRFELAKSRRTGPQVIMPKDEEDRILQTIAQDPMTWVMAILAHLDDLEQKHDMRDKEIATEIADIEKRLEVMKLFGIV